MTEQSLIGEVFEVELDTLGYGGEAIGRLPDGRAVFVSFGLPGETVRLRVTEEKRGYARAELLEVLKPSPERILPLCIHFVTCGGCHYQHMSYEDQLQAKAEILRDQLQRIGRMDDPPVRATVPSPKPYYYRNHIQFHQTTEGDLGYYTIEGDRVFKVQECHLPEETINQVWPLLNFEPLPEIERIGLRTGEGEDVQITLESESLELPELSVEDLPVSVVHLSPAGALVMAGSEFLVMKVKERHFRVSADAFFQVNTPMAAAMVDHVLEHLPNYLPLERSTAMDIYSGVGLFSAFLAERVERLIGVEVSSSATEDFVVNLDEFGNVELYEAAAEQVLPQLDLHPDIILVDPPRAGLDRRVLDAILEMRPKVLVYISCNPATLGRDAKRLIRGGYRMDMVTPFELFPQTYHIESISFWRSAE